MNKIVKTVVVLVAGLVLTTGTAVAAPHYGRHCRPAPVHHHCPPPPPPRHHVVHHVEHHECGGGLVGGLIGGLVGGLIGAVAR